MSSLGGILSVARSAMQASQVQLQTTAQNIANAEVDGYSVQRVRVAAQTPLRMTYGSIGTGVVVQGVTQARDRLLDAQFRSATSSAAAEGRTGETLARIEEVLGEPSSTGLASSLDAFWNSWDDLATNPTSVASRGVVRQRGSEVAGMLNGFARQLDDIDRAARTSLTSDIGQVNQLTKQIAGMTVSIVSSEAGGQTANDLRDSRNRLLDQVASLVDTQVIERKDGSVGVYLGGRMLVDGTSYHQIQGTSGNPVNLSFVGETATLGQVGGQIGAGVSSINQRIPSVMADLDTLAGALVRETNAVHVTGVTFTGTPPTAVPAGNFFDQDPVLVGSADQYQTARGMRLAPTLGSATDVASAVAGSAGPGNNTVATQLAALRSKTLSLTSASGGTVSGSLGAFYRYTVTSVALASSQSNGQAQVQETLASQADTRRQSVSGVSTDEELVNMIKQQQAYQAAARLISVVDEMAKTLIDLGR